MPDDCRFVGYLSLSLSAFTSPEHLSMSDHSNNPRPNRPIPTRIQDSFSFTNTEDANIIRYALNDLSPDDLHSQLAKAIKNLHPSQLHNFLDVLRTAGIVAAKHEVAAKDKLRRHVIPT